MLYYFGCWNVAGHYLHQPGGATVKYETVGPFDAWGQRGLPLDGRFAPGGANMKDQDETATALTHIKGWTILAMWDRSVDSRGGCNAAFILEGTHSVADVWAEARRQYPQIVNRLKAAPLAGGPAPQEHQR